MVGFAIGAVTFSLVRYKIQNKPLLSTNGDNPNVTDPNISYSNNIVGRKKE